MNRKFFVYIVRCDDEYLYTGLTANIEKRYNQHKKGLDRNTKHRLPVKLVYIEEFSTRKDAAKRKKEIKGWKREKEEALFNERSSLH
jgi:putative endonuclease